MEPNGYPDEVFVALADDGGYYLFGFSQAGCGVGGQHDVADFDLFDGLGAAVGHQNVCVSAEAVGVARVMECGWLGNTCRCDESLAAGVGHHSGSDQRYNDKPGVRSPGDAPRN